MSVERLTGWKENGRAYVIDCPEFELPEKANKVLQNLADKHAVIEDILGDTYDLDRLRELVEADKLVGKQLWFTKWFIPFVRVESQPISRCVISFSRLRDKSILLHLKDGAIPINMIGDVAYKTKEEAEAALEKEKQNGQKESSQD